MTPPIDWDDVEHWGGTVHIATWAPDRHTAEANDD